MEAGFFLGAIGKIRAITRGKTRFLRSKFPPYSRLAGRKGDSREEIRGGETSSRAAGSSGLRSSSRKKSQLKSRSRAMKRHKMAPSRYRDLVPGRRKLLGEIIAGWGGGDFSSFGAGEVERVFRHRTRSVSVMFTSFGWPFVHDRTVKRERQGSDDRIP